MFIRMVNPHPYFTRSHDTTTIVCATSNGNETFCNSSDHLPPYKRPRYYRIVEKIPYNATGKKLHYAIKQQAAEDLAAGLLKRS